MSIFMEQDDYIILMDVHNAKIPVSDLLRLREIGIKTVYAHYALDWHEVEPSEGNFNWGTLDAYMNRLVGAGMKVLLPVFTYPPDWLGQDKLIISPMAESNPHEKFRMIQVANPDAVTRTHQFIREVMAHYKDMPEICCTYSIPHNGEFLMPPYHRVEYREEDLINFVTSCQKIFAETYHKEIWTSFHNHYARHQFSAGLEGLDDIYADIVEKLPDSKRFLIQFTHFPLGGSDGGYQQLELQREKSKFNLHCYVGSEYVWGLQKHQDFAIQQGVRFITAPLHPDSRMDIKDPNSIHAMNEEIISIFAKAIEKWRHCEPSTF